VVTKVFSVKVRKPEEEEAIEAADMARHAEQLAKAVAKHDDGLPVGAQQSAPPPPPEPLIKAEQECPCGSGKPFSTCHGSEDEATV
jgi:preprotein translocase subunit SecA